MTVRDRDTLYKYFQAGELPTEEHFHDLIESMLNMQDEGFRKTPDHGLQIAAAVGAHALLTFFRAESARQALWTVRYGGTGEQLTLHPGGAPKPQDALLTLDALRRVGINTRDKPQHMLHVNGFVGSRGRAGTYPLPDPKSPPVADGEWHPLTESLSGCMAFEVVASVSGVAGQGQHAMLHAMALNAHNARVRWFDGAPAKSFRRRFNAWLNRWFNPKNRIRCQDAWFGATCNRLELEWQSVVPGEPTNYRLMIRTQCSYGTGVPIQTHLTRLWPSAEEPARKAEAEQ